MKKYIFLNWKCHPSSLAEALRLLAPLRRGDFLKKYRTVVCAPFIFLEKVKKNFKVETGGQNCFWETAGGPFTGEISPLMLKNIGCGYVLVGHSERKKHFCETEEIIAKKLKAGLRAKLKVLLFFGEKSEDSDKEMTRPLESVLKGIDKKNLQNIFFVYEPAFALSTEGGKVLPLARIKEKMLLIKERLKKGFNLENPLIFYGGSVSGDNLSQYLKQKEISGVVIGQASLDVLKMKKIVKTCLGI